MKKCLYCSTVMVKPKTDSMPYFLNRRKYCNSECMRNAFIGRHVSPETEFKKGSGVGEKNHAWRGGRYLSKEGYLYLWVGRREYQLEHRIVMERHLGHQLAKGEHVHHKNHRKTDNRLSNLVVLSAEEHGLLHANERWHPELVGGF